MTLKTVIAAIVTAVIVTAAIATAVIVTRVIRPINIQDNKNY